MKYTLDSIYKFNDLDYSIECIVVDDGSTDGTVEIIESDYGWVRLIKQFNKGAPVARNEGLRNSNGRYVVFLDSDDLLEEGFFDNKIELLEQNQDASGVYGPFAYFKGIEGFEEELIIPRHTDYPVVSTPSFEQHLQRLVGGLYIPCNAIVWRKEVILSVDGQNESLSVNQDVDLMFRILVKSYKIAGVPSGRALIRMHEGERVGVIDKDEEKVEQVLWLRNQMYKKLKENSLDSVNVRENLASYCFNSWVSYRQLYPDIAFQFLKLSKEIFPNLKIKGRWYYTWLGIVIGNERAVKLRSLFK